MNVYQIIVALFALFVIAASVVSIVVVIRSPAFKWKALWVFGCLFGFIGLGINWTTPNDLIFLVGVSIPVVAVFKVLVTGQVFVKTGFPIISFVALAKASGAGIPNVR